MQEESIRNVFGTFEQDNTDFMDEIQLLPRKIVYKGKGYMVYNRNFFRAITVAMGNTDNIKETIIKKFSTKEDFNEYCIRASEVNKRVAGLLSFHDDPEYKFVYYAEGGTIKCYCQKSDDSKELEFITDSMSQNYLLKIVRRIRYMGLRSLYYVASDRKIENALNMEITRRKRFMAKKPKMVSNDSNVYCQLFVPLDREGECPTWDAFLNQFDDKGKKAVRYWVYNLFNENAPDDKFILYIKGDGNTGKTTFCNALAEIMGHELYHTLSGDRNDMSRSSAVKGKLLVSIPDNKDRNIMQDQLLFNVSGKDLSSVRFMYTEAEMIRHSAKIIITSNILPKFDLSFDYNRIRYLLCETKTKLKKIARAEERLQDEFLYFINKCHKEFNKDKED